MNFTSFSFLTVYPLIFLLYHLIPAKYNGGGEYYLLIVSYLLYIQWKPAFALVLLFVTLVSYLTALLVERARHRRSVLTLGLMVGLLPLFLFKYLNFLTSALCLPLPGLNWAVPVGISFFTFQAVGYVVDVYYGRQRAERSFVAFALFVSFFPCIVAGPINKASLLLPQIKALRPGIDYAKFGSGLRLVLWGMFMKVVVADRVGLYVDTVLPFYTNYSGLTCLAASVLYSVQIYADFAGYSLMAIGVGRTLGFELTENFRRPYFATSVTDFWRRWHISLSTWLRDYIYIPLGGSRCPRGRNYANILATFLVSGIWHGANWTFIVWGLMHGVAQVAEKALGLNSRPTGRAGRAVKTVCTFLLVTLAWIFFRMPTLNDAVGVIRRIFDPSQPLSVYNGGLSAMFFMAVGLSMLIMKDVKDEWRPAFFQAWLRRHPAADWGRYVVLVILILLTGVFGADQFIYANF